MKHLLLASFLVVSFLGYPQNWEFEKPDYSVIKKNIENKNSGLFYETLMARFVEADTTLTSEEKRHLYYGYSFNENYSPFVFHTERVNAQIGVLGFFQHTGKH